MKVARMLTNTLLPDADNLGEETYLFTVIFKASGQLKSSSSRWLSTNDDLVVISKVGVVF